MSLRPIGAGRWTLFNMGRLLAHLNSERAGVGIFADVVECDAFSRELHLVFHTSLESPANRAELQMAQTESLFHCVLQVHLHVTLGAKQASQFFIPTFFCCSRARS